MSHLATDDGSAGSLVGPHLARQIAVLMTVDRALQHGDDSVVHDGRVATRRLRSIVRVFSHLFDADAAKELERELRWWSNTLGPLRDLQVLQERLSSLATEHDDAPLIDAVSVRITDELRQRQREHWATVRDAQGSPRHDALLHDLRRWASRPPWTSKADRPAAALAPRIARADRAVVRRLDQAKDSGDVEDMHRARKAGKRARYAREVLPPPKGRKARKATRRYQQLQDLLGEHHDSTMAAQLFESLGRAADETNGGNGFAFGVLSERERRRAQTAAADAQRLAHRLTR